MVMNKKPSHTIAEIEAKIKHYCAYQDRCHLEVERKLNEFFLIEEARDNIILKLIEEGFLNEERFALSFARGKFYNKKWGKLKIILELKSRNISDYLINKALKQEINQADYLSTLDALIEKKSLELGGESNYEKKAKIVRYLQSKGYEFDLIMQSLD